MVCSKDRKWIKKKNGERLLGSVCILQRLLVLALMDVGCGRHLVGVLQLLCQIKLSNAKMYLNALPFLSGKLILGY